MADDGKKLDSWNAPFDINRDGKMSPEEKALRDYTIMNSFFDDEDKSDGDGGGGGGGCVVPFLVIGGISGTAVAGLIHGVVQLIQQIS